MDLYNIRKIWNPDWFQGNQKRRNYFEGWYFKIVNKDASVTYAIIPGISIGNGPKSAYLFIQAINGTSGDSRFIRYRMEEFSFSRKEFNLSIAGNHFSGSGITLNIKDGDFALSGSISFHNPHPYPVKLFSPGVMGWYRFVPTMECYHGIVSMIHTLQGNLDIEGRKTDFTGGKGYIEKDWGKSMPLSWIWIQSNHFTSKDLSVSFSIANIPWKKKAFTGFLIILSSGNKLYRFTTYTGARITGLSIKEGHIWLEVSNRQYILSVRAHGDVSGNLKAPVDGSMVRTIRESIGARVSIRMVDHSGKVILEDTGNPAGLEVAGDIEILKRDLVKDK